MKQFRKSLLLFLCSMLIVAMALFTTGCSNDENETTTEVVTTNAGEDDTTSSENTAIVKGTGETVFMFNVVAVDGTEKKYEIHTDKETVGEALEELGLIKGEKSTYGLYVKTVDGVTYDYDKDGKYWAFYVDGEYASKGVDSTEIETEKTYTFKAE